MVLVFIFLKANSRHYEMSSLQASLKSLDVTSISPCCKKIQSHLRYHPHRTMTIQPPSHLTEISTLPFLVLILPLSWTSFLDSIFLLTSLIHAPNPCVLGVILCPLRTDHLEKYWKHPASKAEWVMCNRKYMVVSIPALYLWRKVITFWISGRLGPWFFT